MIAQRRIEMPRPPGLRAWFAISCSVHRADLLDVLATGLAAGTVQLGARCVCVQATADGASARFADGAEIEADISGGADGIHSAACASLIGPAAQWKGMS